MMTVRNGVKEPILEIGDEIIVKEKVMEEDPEVGTEGVVLGLFGIDNCCIACSFPSFRGHKFDGQGVFDNEPIIPLAAPTGWWMIPSQLRHKDPA